MACLCKCLTKCCFWRTEAPYSPTNETIPINVFDDETDQKMTKEGVLIYQILQGIRFCASNKKISSPSITSNTDSDNKENQVYNIASPSRTKGGVIILKNYSSLRFKDIRVAEGISEQEYAEAWRYAPQDIPDLETGAGRSGSLFFVSSNGRFIFKTLPHHEVETLRTILPHYHKYITNHSDSRLMRFFALHRFRIQNSFLYIVVANNIFYSPLGLSIDIKYDLKGRRAKNSSLRKKSITGPSKGNIWKDNQLDRKFYPDHPEELIDSIIRDAEFLKSQECIDYSLLVGVHQNNKRNKQLTELSVTQKERRSIRYSGHVTNVDDDLVSISGSVNNFVRQLSIETKEEVGKRRKKRTRGYSFSHIHPAVGVGLPSVDPFHDEVYFFGIIDFLSRYFSKKKTANFFKTKIWHEDTLSTVPPTFYRDRFCTYMPNIIDNMKDQIELKQRQSNLENSRPPSNISIHYSLGDDIPTFYGEGSVSETTEKFPDLQYESSGKKQDDMLERGFPLSVPQETPTNSHANIKIGS